MKNEEKRHISKSAKIAITQNILLICIVSVLYGIFAEIGTRIFWNDFYLFPRYHADADYGEFKIRRLRPSTEFWHTSPDGTWKFVTNRQGYRDEKDFSYSKPEGELRVIALGDSHTQGHEVRQNATYSAVMERFLRDKGYKARVMNTGISGFGTAEQHAFLESEGLNYKPDAVVVGFSSNDFDDNLKSGLFGLKDGELFVRKDTHLPGVQIMNIHNSVGLLRWMSGNSRFYSLMMNTVWTTAKRALLGRARAEFQQEYATAVKDVDRFSQVLALKILERMARVCRRNNIALIIIDIPRAMAPASHDFRSSAPMTFARRLNQANYMYVSSETVLGAYRGVTEFHVPHGARHISEFSHLMLGLAAGQAVLRSTNSMARHRPR